MSTAVWLTTRGCVLAGRQVLQSRHCSQTASAWRRPQELPFPKVWRRFTGRMKLADSTPIKFRIQDVPENMFETVVSYLSEVLPRDEPMYTALGFSKDATSLKEMQRLWREMLQQRVSLIAFLDEPKGTPIVAGCNLLCVADKVSTSVIPEVSGEASKRLLEALHHVDTAVDVFSRYEVSQYLTGMGLAVGPDFRGLGLGTELLRARMDMGRALRIPLTVTLFTSPVSQAVAHTVGMDLLTEMPYENFLLHGKPAFPGAQGSFRLMAKRIE